MPRAGECAGWSSGWRGREVRWRGAGVRVRAEVSKPRTGWRVPFDTSGRTGPGRVQAPVRAELVEASARNRTGPSTSSGRTGVGFAQTPVRAEVSKPRSGWRMPFDTSGRTGHHPVRAEPVEAF